MEKVEIKIEEGVKTLEILSGNALVKKEPVKVEIKGLIDSVFRYLEKRKGEIDAKKCFVKIDRDTMLIHLVINEKDAYQDTITGKLIINPDFEKFEINSGHTRTTFELSDFIKMNRSFFEKKQTAMKLVSELRSFKAKVEKDLEMSDDNRGNKKVKIYQAVESNIPESFKLSMPIFKGHSKQTIEVEISIDASDFSCSLVSPDAKDFIIEMRDELLEKQIDLISVLVPELLIVEV